MDEKVIITKVTPRVTQCPKCMERYPSVSTICDACKEKIGFPFEITEQFTIGNMNTRILEGIRKVADGKKDSIVVTSPENMRNYLIRAKHDWEIFQELNLSKIENKRQIIPRMQCLDCGVCNVCKKCIKCGFVFKSKDNVDKIKCPECHSSKISPLHVLFDKGDKKKKCPKCKSEDIDMTTINLKLEEEQEKIGLILSIINEMEFMKEEDKIKIKDMLAIELKCPKCKSKNIKTMGSGKFDSFRIERRRFIF